MIILFLLAVTYVHAQGGPLTVISNPNGAPAGLNLRELKSVFMGEKQRWRNGTKVLIALMKPATNTGRLISDKVYNMSSDQVNKFWLALVFQGKTESPVSFDSPDALVNFVNNNPGAIGILNQSDVPTDAAITLVDGKKAF